MFVINYVIVTCSCYGTRRNFEYVTAVVEVNHLSVGCSFAGYAA